MGMSRVAGQERDRGQLRGRHRHQLVSQQPGRCGNATPHAALRRGVPDERLAADPGGHGYAMKKWSVLVGVETRR